MKIVLTGDRPTGPLHLGHYVGSLKNRLKLQEVNDHKTYIMIANIQAFSDYYREPELISQKIYQIVEDYLSVGIDPSLSTIFLQSEIKALYEITIYYLNLVSVARAQQNPTVKDEIEQKKFNKSIPCGFLCYPISQAADITAFLTDYVPVGIDQLPMIEQTNEIVAKFNSIYNCNVLKRCEAVLSSNSRLVGIDGLKKASKSLNNTIFLSDNDSELEKKVNSMYTDPNHIRLSDPGNVSCNVVFKYLDAFYENKGNLEDLKDRYVKGGLGDKYLKELLITVLKEFLEPIRQRRAKINFVDIVDIVKTGNHIASQVANETLSQIRSAMFLDKF